MRRVKNGVADWLDADRLADKFASGDTTDRLGADRAVSAMHLACLGVIWVGGAWSPWPWRSALYVAAHVRDHRLLPPLLLPPHVQDLARRAVRVRAVWARRRCSAARSGGRRTTATTMSHSDGRRTCTRRAARLSLVPHMGWFLAQGTFAPDLGRVRDLLRYPELRWLDRFDILVPLRLAARPAAARRAARAQWPELGTSGGQMLVWGFFISTVACYHGTYTINSLCHVWGRRRYATGDDEPQQLAARAHHARRGLAQQPPPLPGLGAPGLLLVGNRPHLLRPEGDVVDAPGVGSQARAAAGLGERAHRRRRGVGLTPALASDASPLS